MKLFMKLFFTFMLFIAFTFNLFGQLPDNYKELLVRSPDGNIDAYLDIMYELAPGEEAFIALIRMIEPQLDAKNWQNAITILETNKDYFPEKTEFINDIIEILNRPDEELEELNIGSRVNSLSSEIAPIQTADEKTLYFTAKKREGFDNETDDIFVSKNVNGIWTPAEKVDAPFNTPFTEESPQGVTTDGNTMILFGNYQEKPGGGDLYYAERTPYGWTEAI